ncbi:MAG: hypothetical protein OXI96_06180 [Acidimicrobiaceae bacterium]|nr:hypothetical protein [Acidimicrobiaceae bacterium]
MGSYFAAVSVVVVFSVGVSGAGLGDVEDVEDGVSVISAGSAVGNL